MAPRKRKTLAAEDEPSAKPPAHAAVTRRSARLANADSVAKQQPELPNSKKAKQTKKDKPLKVTKPKEEEEVVEEETKAQNEDVEEEHKGERSGKTVIIEHCKQCNQFKTRAFKVKEGLEKGVPGISVILNPDKPRRGCFEIREEGGDTFISLLGMKRPFQPMRDLDMEQVISNIINKYKPVKVTKSKEETKVQNEDREEECKGDRSSKTIIIEHCKQCNQFKTRAFKVKEGLEKGVPGISVIINPDKPRRGCFEIREEGGDTFISLLGMKRPFQPMRDLDMEQVISDIINKIK